jgi:ribosomal protein L33
MKLNLNSRLNRILVVCFVSFFSAYLIHSSIISWLSSTYAIKGTESGYRKAISLNPHNPLYYFLLGMYLNLDFGDSKEEVLSLYKQALELSSFNYTYWISLAEFFTEKGKTGKAEYALRVATNMAPGVPSLRWRAGMLAANLGTRDAVLENLSEVIANDPRRRNMAFAALWQVVGDAQEILDLVTDDVLPSYIYFLMQTKRLEETKLAWKRYDPRVNDTTNLAIKYVNFLIEEGDISSARFVWKETFGDWQGIWNGRFEEEPMNGGFDWRVRNVEGVRIERVKNESGKSHSIMVSFDGKHNVDFRHLYQFIAVTPVSEYVLSSDMKADGITTRNGIQWEVYCYSSGKSLGMTKPIIGTHDWHSVKLPFKTPGDCSLIVIRLRRHESDKLDRFISGSVWIDKVELNNSR